MKALKTRIFSLFLCVFQLMPIIGLLILPTAALTSTGITPTVSIGGSFMLAVNADGELLAWGDNSAGTLGDGTKNASATPIVVPTDVTFSTVCAGFDHALALSTGGIVYAWGANDYGQLGADISEQTTAPTPVTALAAVRCVSIAAGKHFSLALTEDGRVFAWGRNQLLQLGESQDVAGTQRAVPHPITALEEEFIVAIGAGASSAYAKTSDGAFLVWGDNSLCHLFYDNQSKLLPQALPDSILAASPTQLALGANAATVLFSDGTIASAGCNRYGQFGNGATSENATAIPKPADETAPLFSAVSAGTNHTVALTASGEVYLSGKLIGDDGDTAQPLFTKLSLPTDSVACAVLAGYECAAALTTDGKILTWGENGSGQLGNGTTANAVTPTVVLDADGQPLTLGDSDTMQSVSVQISTTIPAPTYALTIPSAIDLGVLRQASADDEDRFKSTSFTVVVDGIADLPDSQSLTVSVSGSEDTFVLTDKSGNRLPYEIYLTEIDGTPVESGNAIASFTDDGSVTCWILVDQSEITASGRYTDVLSFHVYATDKEDAS